MINRLVIDISIHNAVVKLAGAKASGIVGVIHKATEGRTFVDRTYKARRQMAKDAGLLWGAYHFANDGDVRQQVANFFSTAEPDDNTLMALDFEPNGNHTMSLEQAEMFVELAEAKLGRRIVLYSGNLIKETLATHGTKERLAWWGKRKLWLAQYSKTWHVPAAWAAPWLWQYSDGEVGPPPHGVSGITGAVDCNSYSGTPEQLAKEWAQEKIA